jgi:hypothetical protein
VSSPTAEIAANANHTDPILLHWVMTVQTNDGRQATNDGRIKAIPGVHTRETTYQAVRNAMKDVVGTDHFTVLLFSLAPNQL